MDTNKKIKPHYLFIYDGQYASGKAIQGKISAVNIQMAKLLLRQQNIFVSKIKRKNNYWKLLHYKPIKSRDITSFARQLANLIAAGIPIIDAVDIIIKTMKNPHFLDLLTQVRDEVAAGNKLGAALEKYPKYFKSLFCTLIKIGEESGSLAKMLDRLAWYQEKNETLKRKIKKALFYPVTVIMVAIGISILLLVKIVPEFEHLFSNFGANLPSFTRFVLDLSSMLRQYWLMSSFLLLSIIFAFILAKKKILGFASFIDRSLLHLPILGKLLETSMIARFARTLAISLAAGLPMLNALKLVAQSPNNLIYQRALENACKAINTGQQLNKVLEETRLFPGMVIEMIAIGEETGKIDQMLSKIAEDYEENIDTSVDGLSSLIEPLIMTLIGAIVGSLVIAMYLPIFQLGSVFK